MQRLRNAFITGNRLMNRPTLISIAQPDIGEEEEKLVLEVVRSGRLTQGPMVERLESLTCEMAGTNFAIAVCNGTASLELILEALNLGPGDEVITTPLTFAATLNVILRAGASPRFADIGSDFNISPEAVTPLIGPRTKAVLLVHLYGAPADAPSLVQICENHGLFLVEDAAQAHGASISDRNVGSFGVGSFSFYASKNIAAGEGGAITTSNTALGERLTLLRNQGMRNKYEHLIVGTNRRMTELQAAIAIPQMQRLETTVKTRRNNARVLTELLADTEIEVPHEREGTRSAWHQYTVLLPPGVDRNVTMAAMQQDGVEARAYYDRLVWDHPAYESLKIVDETPLAQGVVKRCLSLPIHQHLGSDELERVAEALIRCLR
jgi:perosamine synthetase